MRRGNIPTATAKDISLEELLSEIERASQYDLGRNGFFRSWELKKEMDARGKKIGGRKLQRIIRQAVVDGIMECRMVPFQYVDGRTIPCAMFRIKRNGNNQ